MIYTEDLILTQRSLICVLQRGKAASVLGTTRACNLYCVILCIQYFLCAYTLNIYIHKFEMVMTYVTYASQFQSVH